MDDLPIDLSSLDPQRDPARFEQMVRAVVAGATRPALVAHWLALELVQLGRVAVVTAAFLAAIAWLPSVVHRRADTEGNAVASATDPVELVSTWAYAGRVPSNVDPVQALGALHDR